jgi:hypothetical protein
MFIYIGRITGGNMLGELETVEEYEESLEAEIAYYEVVVDMLQARLEEAFESSSIDSWCIADYIQSRETVN